METPHCPACSALGHSAGELPFTPGERTIRGAVPRPHGGLSGELGTSVSDTGESRLPCFPMTVNDLYSLLHRTSDVVPNQLKKLHRRHRFCVCVCVCVCVREREREREGGREGRAGEGGGGRRGGCIRGSSIDSGLTRQRRAAVQGEITSQGRGLLKAKTRSCVVSQKNPASTT